jgi:hypothetical protein
MSIAVDELHETETDDAVEYARYKAVSTAAVASLVVGLLSLLTFLDFWFAFIPVVGLVLGAVALKKIRANPEELTGEPVAKLGLALNLVIGIAGPATLLYIYATEVPDWAQRISYAELQPDKAVPGEVVPPSVRELDGQKVFIKGFIFPDSQKDGIRQFVLCRDKGDCCFGGDPKLTERILVTLAEPNTIGFSEKMFKVAGTFHFKPTQAPGTLGAVLYHLDAEYVK